MKTFTIVIVDNAGSHTYTYKGNWLLTDAIKKAMHTTGLKGITSVTATVA